MLFTKNQALLLLTAMYIVGFIGLQLTVTKPYFELLVPFNLITTLAILLYFHKDCTRQFIYLCILIALVGYGVEVAGVHTQAIFGQYQYQTTLGLKVFNVPLMIACNWLVLIYCTGTIFENIHKNLYIKALGASFLMVLLDFFIEPVAIKHQFWSWHQNIIPLQNYIAWFAVSFFLLYIFYKTPFHKKNDLALPIYLLNLLFFVAHNITYHSF